MTHSGGKPHAVGDRGQRFEVTIYDEEISQRRVLGWAETEDGARKMGEAACLRPSWSKYELNDRGEQIRRRHPLATNCSSCGAAIVWFKTLAGKRMPVDEASTLPTDAQHQLDLKRHKSHFATCKDAETWRKPR